MFAPPRYINLRDCVEHIVRAGTNPLYANQLVSAYPGVVTLNDIDQANVTYQNHVAANHDLDYIPLQKRLKQEALDHKWTTDDAPTKPRTTTRTRNTTPYAQHVFEWALQRMALNNSYVPVLQKKKTAYRELKEQRDDLIRERDEALNDLHDIHGRVQQAAQQTQQARAQVQQARQLAQQAREQAQHAQAETQEAKAQAKQAQADLLAEEELRLIAEEKEAEALHRLIVAESENDNLMVRQQDLLDQKYQDDIYACQFAQQLSMSVLMTTGTFMQQMQQRYQRHVDYIQQSNEGTPNHMVHLQPLPASLQQHPFQQLMAAVGQVPPGLVPATVSFLPIITPTTFSVEPTTADSTK